MNSPRILVLVLLLVGTAAAEPPAAPLPYLDPAQPTEARVQDLVRRMTLEEKASMMRNTTPGVPRLGIPKYDWWSEALHGVANAGKATVFPQAIGLAAMWDEPLQHEIAGTIGIEARAKFNGYAGTEQAGTIFHGLTFWSPNINIFRDPRWGRGQETYGEDPFLTSRLGVAFVRGLQGDDPDHLLAAACAKHYAVHSGPEPLRHNFDVSPPEADLYETYLPAFEALVREGRVEAVMTAYNSLYGQPCSINPLLYMLLAKWGFNGHITSDCGSIEDLIHSYKRAPDEAGAEALALKAGLSVRCGWEPVAVAEAVKRGELSEAEVDYRVSTLLRTMFRLGFFDPADRVSFNRIAPAENDTPAHGALALRAAHEAMVLLKNDGTLPLDPAALKRVAVIGPSATSVPVLLGNYNGTPSAPVTVLAGLRAALEPAGVKVDYAHGCDYAARPTTARPIPFPWFVGDYFANPDLAGKPVATNYDRPLSFGYDTGALERTMVPHGVPDRDISVRWKAELPTTVAGDYEFVLRGRGGFRLRLGGETLIDAWTTPPGGTGKDRRFSATRRLPENATLPLEVDYRQGDGPMKVSLEWITPAADADEAEALRIAPAADAIIYVGGISPQIEGEEMRVDYAGFNGGDRTAIELPAVQEELLRKLQATGKPVVFVNLSGSAVAMPWADAHVNAVLQAWYPGQAGGTAVADVIFGKYNPAGRLPVTFYRATTDLPAFENYDMAGRTYRYFKGKALYAFGHGLSYTKFAYANLRVSPAVGLDRVLGNSTTTLLSSDPASVVTVEVTNGGDRDGDEVVQVYAVPSGARENEALCGFSRVHLTKGETKAVNLMVPASALRRWSVEKKAYVIPSGEWTFRVGAASDDIRQTVTVKL